ncbi:ABC transporter ATP-binding protein [[Clostridium] polysaccharolyticum]|uniref:ATP-binding cassette, subfamily B n=1 Tax=[Clostridium] polysaccharolyticum TaxID=29364 RepID=A0A1I0EDL4_9FIRM|nr:ABC transporter ATP-binding protein [[Clostridium] polysaccharolyticum]SET43062.1 ATP-binding cassette, subfamily B [[Clostridium] polysaccharolyticum]
MKEEQVLKGNRQFHISIGCTIIEGLLSGSNFMLIYYVFQALWNGTLNMKKILQLTGGLLLIFLARIVIYSYGYVQGQIGGAKVSRQIRLFLGDKLRRIPLSRFTAGQTGDYINVATSNVNSYENVLTHKTGDLAKNITLSLMLIGFVSTMHLKSGMILLAADLLLVPALWFSFYQVKKYGTRKNEICAENVSSIVEYITGIQTFRAYGIGGTKNKTVTKAMKAFSDISFIYEVKVIPVGMFHSILSWFSMPLVIWIAGKSWLTGDLATVDYLIICFLPLFLSKLSDTIFIDLTSYKNLTIAKRQIEKVIYEQEETKSSQKFEPVHHDICLEHVDFAYVEKEPILKDVSITIPDQKLTAIVGDSGSGKSTILNIISKYYELEKGDIKIGGIPTHNVGAEQVLSQISMVDQDVFLFDDTVRNNIRYARPSATDQEIEEACRLANCDGFIKKMAKGYETMVGENGNQLSGGERQRLSIARAILKNAPILLLDEATASLDVENELAVKDAIANLLREKKTVVMIAHTLSIVQKAAQIGVVSKGRIVESGTHEELLKKNGKYAAMWKAEQKLSC